MRLTRSNDSAGLWSKDNSVCVFLFHDVLLNLLDVGLQG